MLAFVRRSHRLSLSRFVAVGSLAACIDFTVFNLALLAVGASRWHVLLANTASFAAATCVGFALNSRYTFRAVRTRSSFMRYLAIALVGVGIYDLGLLLALLWVTPGDVLLTNAAKVVAVVPSATWNYLGFRRFAFGGGGGWPPSRRAQSGSGTAAGAGDGRR